MASTSISAITALISGVAPDSGAVAASGDTCTITAPSGSDLDFSRLVVRIANGTGGSGTIATLGVGDSDFSGYPLSTYAVTVGSAATVVIGGKDFESARFKTSAESLVITFTGGDTGTVVSAIEAYLIPSGFTA